MIANLAVATWQARIDRERCTLVEVNLKGGSDGFFPTEGKKKHQWSSYPLLLSQCKDTFFLKRGDGLEEKVSLCRIGQSLLKVLGSCSKVCTSKKEKKKKSDTGRGGRGGGRRGDLIPSPESAGRLSSLRYSQSHVWAWQQNTIQAWLGTKPRAVPYPLLPFCTIIIINHQMWYVTWCDKSAVTKKKTRIKKKRNSWQALKGRNSEILSR